MAQHQGARGVAEPGTDLAEPLGVAVDPGHDRVDHGEGAVVAHLLVGGAGERQLAGAGLAGEEQREAQRGVVDHPGPGLAPGDAPPRQGVRRAPAGPARTRPRGRALGTLEVDLEHHAVLGIALGEVDAADRREASLGEAEGAGRHRPPLDRHRPVVPEDGVVGWLEQSRRGGVGDHGVGVQRHHRPGGATRHRDEAVEQVAVHLGGVLVEAPLDLAGPLLHEGDHERTGVLKPAGDIDDPLDATGDGVADRRPGAGEPPQPLRVVLAADHPGDIAHLRGGADAVGSDAVLGVEVAGREEHAVEAAAQRGGAGAAVEHQAVGVGEDDHHVGVGHLGGQPVEDRGGEAHQPGVGVEVRVPRRRVPDRGHAALPGAHPGERDLGPHPLGDDPVVEEAFAALPHRRARLSEALNVHVYRLAQRPAASVGGRTLRSSPDHYRRGPVDPQA
ncbi:MAG: hypothetical protein E6J03_02470 [Chloroflexi bacterium]|nr:MAG: hypothetical protein E6J03_02470 [Chloroflexota bacterium]